MLIHSNSLLSRKIGLTFGLTLSVQSEERIKHG
jgi:hypothetical protein